MEKIKEHIGNIELLKLSKIAFLCSRQISASAVLRCYDWAIAQREAGHCVISGFHSVLEKDVLHYLLKGEQPVIIALARGLKKRLEPELKEPLDKGRLLIITPFENNIIRISPDTAQARNQFMVELADEIVIGYCKPEGQLDKLLKSVNKPKAFLTS